MLAALAEAGSIVETAALDSIMSVRTARRVAAKRGAKSQAISPSRGGQTTEVHVLTDVLGRPTVIHLTPSKASDVMKAAPDVLAAVPGRLRRGLRAEGTKPVETAPLSLSWSAFPISDCA